MEIDSRALMPQGPWHVAPVGDKDPNGIGQHEPGAKVDAGKPDLSLLLMFGRAITAVAEVGTFGAKKYTRGGWQHVPQGFDRYSAALLRHYFKSQVEGIDPDSGLEHLAHMAWNALAVLELHLREKENGSTGREEKDNRGATSGNIRDCCPCVEPTSGHADSFDSDIVERYKGNTPVSRPLADDHPGYPLYLGLRERSEDYQLCQEDSLGGCKD